jgi:hypothetical protein
LTRQNAQPTGHGPMSSLVPGGRHYA